MLTYADLQWVPTNGRNPLYALIYYLINAGMSGIEMMENTGFTLTYADVC